MIRLSRFHFGLLFVLSGCAAATQPLGQLGDSADTVETHETLHSVLWTQTATEFAGVTRGAYALASLRLEEALENPNWTASLEQLNHEGYSGLPPAVILDVDETVLDNSAYQARLIQNARPYETSTWNEWIREEKAAPIPGALEFTRYAASRGVKVIYVTNRVKSVENATRNNLATLGFPLDPVEDLIFTKRERPEWAASDKTSRREHISQTYRILLLIGDNYGDFSESARGSLSERMRSEEDYAPYWGSKWIVLPNSMYGSWESTLYDSDFTLSDDAKLQSKKSYLKDDR